MSGKFRFSIVIPTRDREQTLRHTLRTCLDQIDFDDYEIVVHDNSDYSHTGILASQMAVQDPRARGRLKYSRRRGACSMARHFEDAIAQAEGEFIIVLGDDDGLLPRALHEINALIERTNGAIIKWSPGLYTWPNLALPGQGNYLRIGLERALGIANGREELARALERLSYDNLPSLYLNTAVRRDVVENIRDQEGRLFQSRSPGAYSAVVMGYLCGDFVATTIPFTLDGLSRFSTRVSNSFSGEYGLPRAEFWKLNWQDQIYHHGQIPNVPAFPAVDFADAFTHAKTRLFSTDETIVLSRPSVMRACIERSDTTFVEIPNEVLRASEDDPALKRITLDLLNELPDLPPIPLKPAKMTPDGHVVNLDGNDFGLLTIQDAVRLAHKVLWPADAPLRYDLELEAAAYGWLPWFESRRATA